MAPQSPMMSIEPVLWNGNANGVAPGGLLGAASNYPYPLTSGLLGSLGSSSQGAPNYSQVALQMAGNPHAGPYAQVAPPSGVGIPGAVSPSGASSGASGGSSVVGTGLGLLRDVQQGQRLYNAVSGLLSPGVSPSDLSGLFAQSAPAADAVQPLVTTPAQAGITPVDGPLYSGAPSADADLAAQQADQYAANGGLLAASSALPAGVAPAATAADASAAAAANTISPAVADSINAAAAPAAADTAAPAAADTSSSLGAYAGPVIGAALAYQLGQGLLSGSGHYHPTGNDILSNTNDWLNSTGPGLASITGDGSAQYPMTVYLKDGTKLTGDQYQQLQDMNAQFLQSNNSTRGTHSAWSGLTPDQTAQMLAYIKSVATPGSNTATLPPDQLAALQAAQQYAQQAQQSALQNYGFGGLLHG